MGVISLYITLFPPSFRTWVKSVRKMPSPIYSLCVCVCRWPPDAPWYRTWCAYLEIIIQTTVNEWISTWSQIDFTVVSHCPRICLRDRYSHLLTWYTVSGRELRGKKEDYCDVYRVRGGTKWNCPIGFGWAKHWTEIRLELLLTRTRSVGCGGQPRLDFHKLQGLECVCITIVFGNYEMKTFC